jgi:hypothetical protein
MTLNMNYFENSERLKNEISNRVYIDQKFNSYGKEIMIELLEE